MGLVAPSRTGSSETLAARSGQARSAQDWCCSPRTSFGRGCRENMMEKIQGAMRSLLASTIVQCCEAVDENLAHWLKGSVAARRQST
jgi:hypothetical protein